MTFPPSTSANDHPPGDALESHGRVWDVIVIGTGMGGATAGLSLARLGHQVLFVEKGRFIHQSLAGAPPSLAESVLDPFKGAAENVHPIKDSASGRDNERYDRGWWPEQVEFETESASYLSELPIGCGSGGSTAFYAATLERFSRADFKPRKNFPHATDSSLPDAWPISYEDLEPYYEQAEVLYGVRGTPDPLYEQTNNNLLPPLPLNSRDEHFREMFLQSGLHPYRVHAGYKLIEDCDGCEAGHCPKACKSDAAWISLIPALAEHGAKILPECEVVRLVTDSRSIQGIGCEHKGHAFTLSGKIVILAAGAFSTPAILLRSKSECWPNGVSNRSGEVGRNLMFHAGDFIAIKPDRSMNGTGPQKTLALNDFYLKDGQKLGTFQTLGARLEVGSIMQFLRDSAHLYPGWWSWLISPTPALWRKVVSPFLRIGIILSYRLLRLRDAAIWVSIVEDLPYTQNRVKLSDENDRIIQVSYKYSDELKARVLAFREHLKKTLGARRLMVLSPDNKIDYPHVSGTCRFGNDPERSVLNRNNQSHEIDNLYVVDSSFFPSSAGTNPSLTIAANALRVSEFIDQKLSE